MKQWLSAWSWNLIKLNQICYTCFNFSIFYLILSNQINLITKLIINYLHEAVAVGVVVDAGELRGVPAQQHQVELSVALVNEVACVPVQEFNK